MRLSVVGCPLSVARCRRRPVENVQSLWMPTTDNRFDNRQPTTDNRFFIVGGGISGLSAAYYLAKAGISSTLIEKRPRLGGVIETERIDGCLVEGGPDSFLAAKPWAIDLIRDLGLESEVIGSNDTLRK